MEHAGGGGSKPAAGVAGGTTPETGETRAKPVINKPMASGGVPARRAVTGISSKLAGPSIAGPPPAAVPAPVPPSQLEFASAGGKAGESGTPTSPHEASTSPTSGGPALTHEAVLAKRQALGLNPALLSRAAPGTSKLSPSAPPVSGLALFESGSQPQ